MQTRIVLTLTGTERIGIVEEVTKLLLDLGCNVETSRMARLGGDFAIMMLVSLPEAQLVPLDRKLAALTAQGFKVTISQTRPGQELAPQGRLYYQIDVQGADHEGLIHQVSRHLAQRGINIESLDTATAPAPNSGTPLFTMKALVSVPPGLPLSAWKGSLKEEGQELNLLIKVTAAKAPLAKP